MEAEASLSLSDDAHGGTRRRGALSETTRGSCYASVGKKESKRIGKRKK